MLFLLETLIKKTKAMSEKLGQETAFPVDAQEGFGIQKQKGMSKRFYAACAAMQGIISGNEINRTGRKTSESIIEMAYKFADELLKQESL